MLARAEENLARCYRQVATAHTADADVSFACAAFAREADEHVAALAPALDRYADRAEEPPERLHAICPGPPRTGPIGLLRDLADLHQLATLVESTWQLIAQAAQGARDRDLIAVCGECTSRTTAQLAWLSMRQKSDAAQTLLVAT
ncbi:hypothetical protein MTP03_43680 [Tsukamurella sp. PLM1]|nr:hypothetical protein MTP03_43680 [Tsukamurella sp. PLM1]